MGPPPPAVELRTASPLHADESREAAPAPAREVAHHGIPKRSLATAACAGLFFASVAVAGVMLQLEVSRDRAAQALPPTIAYFSAVSNFSSDLIDWEAFDTLGDVTEHLTVNASAPA